MRYELCSLAEIRQNAALYEHLLQRCTAGPDGDMTYALTRPRIAGQGLLLWVDEQVVAWAIVWGDSHVEMLDVYVQAHCRGRGYGRELATSLRNLACSPLVVSQHPFFNAVFAGSVSPIAPGMCEIGYK